MQAIVFEGAGGNEVVRVAERAVPDPGPGHTPSANPSHQEHRP